MIPKLLHQTAKTSDLPESCRPYVEKLKALYPEWHYHLWTDEENLELVRTRYPEFLDTYTKLPKNIMRADVIRYVLMYVHGGMYLDTDYEMLKRFDPADDAEVILPLEADGSAGEPERACNAIFWSAPGHPFWKMAIDDLIARPPLAADVDVLSATGPMFLTRILHQARRAGLKIHTPAPVLFNPKTPRFTRQYDAIVRGGRSYGIHHCLGSWRDYSVKDKIKVNLYRVLGKLF